MTSPDPVRDAMLAVFRDGYSKGAVDGMKRATSMQFLKGVIVGALLALLGIGVAVAQTIPPQARDYQRDLTRISRSVWGAQAPVATLAAQIHQESRWRPDAVSPARARGLTQFIDSTAQAVAEQYPELRPVDVFDPRWAMRAQSLLMRDLFESMSGADECQRFAKALAGYNGGPRWVRRAEAMVDDPSRWFGSVELVNPGKAPQNYRETTHYSRVILLTLTPVYYAAMWGPGHCLPAAWRWS